MIDNVIEQKWQKYWEEHNTFEAKNESDKEKYYILVEFPYPSGSGLHVGHVKSYSALDAMARMKRMQGYNVLFPMGWDAFGAPAEQYAIANKIHPAVAVKRNIETFKAQMKTLGFSFDWNREFSTTDPDYYKWTQWQFLQFVKHDMAYKAEAQINWCPKCKSGLSNEDAAGGICERCGTTTEKKLKSQWILKMSKYADRLLDGLKDTEFVEKVKLAQINWIGKSEGAEVKFQIEGTNDYLEVFTTRPDTLYGVTFMVMSPEHKYLDKYKNLVKNIDEIKKYQLESLSKTEIERTDATKEKTGVKVEGLKVINPVNNEPIEIWISDYVLANYGTGAIMAVPAHDERDYAFAKKFNINIIDVIEPITGTPRENEKHKNSIVALIYNPKTDKYLSLNWGNLGGRLLIGGTIEENETALECAIREIKEESGYTDIKFIKEYKTIHHHYFAYNKNQAYSIDATAFYFELESDVQDKQQLEDNESFEIQWVSKELMENEIKDELHSFAFNKFVNDLIYTNDGQMVNSGILNGLTNKEESINKIVAYLEEKDLAKKSTNYRLQDWIFSRQRFWGEPIPMIYCEKCGWVPVKEEDLPVILPDVAAYEPTENGESPLANITEWVNTTCPKCGAPAKRETDTMPNWAGSSWYYLRYMDPHNNKEFVSMEAMKYWGMVDYYNGGMEHAARHLLYARFWHQFLYDQGLVYTKEPFKKRVAHGMILGENNEKMSKSKGNVVNPDDMVKEYGADALRVYEMFIGDYEKDASWSEAGLRGCKRFLTRVTNLQSKLNDSEIITPKVESLIHKTIKKVTNDISTMNYNTAVSALMILANELEKLETISKKDYLILLTLLNPIAPHTTEELVEQNNLGTPICENEWPNFDEEKTIDDTVNIAVSVNGKLRGTITVPKDETKEKLLAEAKQIENVKKYIQTGQIIKEIVVPNKIVNIVVK